MLQFDAETTRLLDEAYLGADISRRRRASFDAIAPAPGETILDLGCGNGLLTLELSRAVGETGHVIALDPSADMLESARIRCAGRDNITFLSATAQSTGLAEESVDKAVSLQVFEYFERLEPPLTELARVVRPGGCVAIGDTHWDTFAWASDDPDRMQRMMQAWEQHLSHRTVPAVLGNLLGKSGFARPRAIAVPFLDTELKPDGLALMYLRLMHGYAIQNGLVPTTIADPWMAEQKRLADEGRFFMHILHVVWTADRI